MCGFCKKFPLVFVRSFLLPSQESSYILGDEERGKTRSETRKSLSEEEKPAVKRANTMEQTAKVGQRNLHATLCTGFTGGKVPVSVCLI